MTLSQFTAEADLHGRRVRLAWRYDFAAGEKLADLPALQVARKELDYEFPDPQGHPDPFLIYDSATFGVSARVLSTTDVPFGTGRRTTDVESLAVGSMETLRRKSILTLHSTGAPVSISVEILDASLGLAPLITYYYELRVPNWAALMDRRPYRSSATTTERYMLGAAMYGMLPEMYRRHDVVGSEAKPELAALPEAQDSGGGQLRRFLEVTGSASDYLRSRAEGMLDIHNARTVDARMLPLMASWIGWDLDFRAAIPVQRHELRYAPALYGMTGTVPGCMIWARRLTGWDARIKEFGRNVFFSNDLGNPDDPTDKGSRTVDTEDAALLAKLKTFDDDVDYSYDTGTDNDSWYAYNAIGLFLKPAANAGISDTAAQVSRLERNLSMFLPVNVRGVVIPDIAETAAPLVTGYSLLSTKEQ